MRASPRALPLVSHRVGSPWSPSSTHTRRTVHRDLSDQGPPALVARGAGRPPLVQAPGQALARGRGGDGADQGRCVRRVWCCAVCSVVVTVGMRRLMRASPRHERTPFWADEECRHPHGAAGGGGGARVGRPLLLLRGERRAHLREGRQPHPTARVLQRGADRMEWMDGGMEGMDACVCPSLVPRIGNAHADSFTHTPFPGRPRTRRSTGSCSPRWTPT